MRSPHREENEQEQFEDNLRAFVDGMRDEWRLVAAFVIFTVVAAGLYAGDLPAVYRTDALLQLVESQSDFSGLGELSDALTGENSTEAELQIITSRSVLLPTVKNLGLARRAWPVRFPILGNFIVDRHDANSGELAEPWFGFSSYAWGGEKIRVDQLDVPRELEEIPLRLIAGSDGRYLLQGPDDELILESAVGEVAEHDEIRILVSELVARPGTHFEVRKDDLLKRVDELRREISVTERGRKTGIVAVEIDGTDPDQIAAILNHISSLYVGQSARQKSADAAAMHEFLNGQLPEVKTEVERSEAALNAYRVERGTIDLSLETQGLLDQLAQVEAGLSSVELERATLEQRFTREHPAMLGLADQVAQLEGVRDDLKNRMREIPKSEQDSFRLMRDQRVANALYTVLRNRTQELKVLQAGTIADVRIVDEAFVPREPIGPSMPLVLSLSAVVDAFLGAGFVYMRRMLDETIWDPTVLEEMSGLPVFGSIPHSKIEESRHAFGSKNLVRGLLATSGEYDPAIEALRALRTNLEFMIDTEGVKVLTVSGAAPGVGKSFISANIAVLMAATNRRVVLVDGDLRRGTLHRIVGQPRSAGLAELLAGQAEISKVMCDTAARNLQLIPTGSLPSNPSELISQERISVLLSKLEMECDFVVFDSPPVLGASEAVVLARCADVSMMVVRSEQQVRHEIETAIKRLLQGGVQLRGFVFNGVKPHGRRSFDYYYGH